MTVMALVVKATLTLMLALGIAVVARRARASLRHLVVAASFALLLLMPLASLLLPVVRVPLPEKARWVQAAAPILEAVGPAAAQSAPSTATAKAFPVALLVAALYLAGVIAGIFWLVRGVLALRGIAGRGQVWLDGMTSMNELALGVGIRRAVLVVVSREVSVPLTFGFLRQTIVVPAAARTWSVEELRRAIRHELEHVRRDDWAWQVVARLACIFYWPHPLVWLAWRRFQLDAEIAADDAVLASFDGSATDGSAYAGQLVALARDVRRRTVLPAMSMASPSTLSSRVEFILASRTARGPIGRFAATAACTCALAVLVAFAPVQVVAAAIDDLQSIRGEVALGESLIKAAEAGNIRKVARLLDAGLDVNTNVEGDGTALLVAARHGHLELIDFLLDRGADVNLASLGDGNPLIVAAQTGRVEIARHLLTRGARVDDVVPGDENPLIAACESGHVDVVHLLLAHGANPSTRVWADNREWRSPLIMARRHGHHDIVQVLIAAGAG